MRRQRYKKIFKRAFLGSSGLNNVGGYGFIINWFVAYLNAKLLLMEK